MRDGFQHSLDRLELLLREEAALVAGALRDAMVALRDSDVDAAQQVIAGDDEIDRRFVEVEQGIERLLATQTPVAVDLRLVLAMIHINGHLERMGDNCVTIAKLTCLSHRLDGDGDVVSSLEEMARQAGAMIEVAIGALVTRDGTLAETLVEMDQHINLANRRSIDALLDLGAAPDQREWGLRMVLVSRLLERIGDHAVDIGEQVAYLVTGHYREFTDASHPVVLG